MPGRDCGGIGVEVWWGMEVWWEMERVWAMGVKVTVVLEEALGEWTGSI